MRLLFLSFLGAFLLGACTTNGASVASNASAEAPATVESADEATAEADNDKEVAELDEDRVICKRTIVTGSRFKKNICRTWAEWKQIEDESSRSVDTLQRRMRGQVSGN